MLEKDNANIELLAEESLATSRLEDTSASIRTKAYGTLAILGTVALLVGMSRTEYGQQMLENAEIAFSEQVPKAPYEMQSDISAIAGQLHINYTSDLVETRLHNLAAEWGVSYDAVVTAEAARDMHTMLTRQLNQTIQPYYLNGEVTPKTANVFFADHPEIVQECTAEAIRVVEMYESDMRWEAEGNTFIDLSDEDWLPGELGPLHQTAP